MIDSGSTKDYLYSVKDLISDPDKYVFVEPNSNMILDLRISKYSGQILPIHAGRAKQLQLQYFGQANVGKTLLITQYSCETVLFSWKKDKKKLCFRCDIPINLPVQNFRNKQINSYTSFSARSRASLKEKKLLHLLDKKFSCCTSVFATLKSFESSFHHIVKQFILQYTI